MALASEDYATKAWVRFADLPALQHPAINFIQGSADAVDCENLTATIKQHGSSETTKVQYDYLVAASGLRRPWPVVPQSLTRPAYLKEAQANIDACKTAEHGVVIIGGGAVGVEMAAELKLVEPNTKVTLIHSRDRLLSAEPLPDEFKDAVAPLVREAGVELILGARVTSTVPSSSNNTVGTSTNTTTYTLTLSNNTTLTASHVLSAISHSTPTTSYLPPTSLDTEGFVKIAPTLHFTSDVPHARRHFAVGDLAAWSGIRRCGAAMHMGHYAAYNIHQQLLFDSASNTSRPSSAHTAGDDAAGKVQEKPRFLSLNEFPPVIGLAVGRKAITYGGPADGVKSGEDVEQLMFGGDLGWGICWRYLKLGETCPAPAPEPTVAPEDDAVAAMAEDLKIQSEGVPVVASAA